MKAIVATSTFPTLSETFVIQQINMLIDEGVDVTILSLYKPETTLVSESLSRNNLMDKVVYVNEHSSSDKVGRLKAIFSGLRKGVTRSSRINYLKRLV
uniref:hypothetical protein n=1 Tax=Vibrio campbellii TaxID=680 RepID=UPI000A7B104C